MEITVAIDGTPDEVKVSCPVWRGGKSGDYFKGLPITIGYDLRRLCPQQPDGRSTLKSNGKPHCAVRQRQQEQKRSVRVSANDGTTAHDAGRTEIHFERQLYRHEDRIASAANPPEALLAVGYYLRGAV